MKKVLLYILLFTTPYLYAQGEAANWFFGYGSGMFFNPDSNEIEILEEGQLSTNEGCASISDSDGNLLFYTDGSTVWNKEHNIMLNGQDLLGDRSSSQSAIIVPRPNSTRFYYIFTVSSGFSPENNSGLNYSIVDIALGSGSGAVTDKNINLLSYSSEKITAVAKDCEANSFWVITLSTDLVNNDTLDNFYAFEVSAGGLDINPVVSSIVSDITDIRGYLKVSPDGNKIATANSNDGLFLYDFDKQTGAVSNQLELTISQSADLPYGIEFSPNNKFLYVNSSSDLIDDTGGVSSFDESNIVQFDLEATNIQSSEVLIHRGQYYRGSLQLAPDGKIYRAVSESDNVGYSYLGVINNPNESGINCNYDHQGLSLEPFTSSQGLPSFIQSYFRYRMDLIRNGVSATDLTICEGETYQLTADYFDDGVYSWYFNGVLLSENSNILEVSEAGNYLVLLEIDSETCPIEGEADITVVELPDVINTTLFQCDEDGIPDGFTTFNLSQANEALTGGISDLSVTYFFSLTDAENNENTLDENSFNNWFNPQVIYARVTNDDVGCFSISELSLEVSATGISDFEPSPLCDELDSEDGINTFNLATITSEIQDFNNITFPVLYYENYQDALLEVNPLANSYVNSNPYSQIIYARVENDNACYGIAEIQLTVNKLPQLEEDQTLLYCLNEFPNNMLTLSGGVLNDDPNNYYYEWFFNGTNLNEDEADITINEIGNYRVIVTTTAGCSKERLFSIEPSNIASIETIEVTDASENNTITVFVSGEGTYQFALDDPNGPYQDSTVFENVIPGFHTVYVRDIKNDCGIVDALVSVIGFPRFFTPNGDSYNERWHVRGVSEQFQPNSKIQIFDRYGRLVSVLTPLGPGWDGTYNGENMPASDYWFAVTLQDGRTFKSHFTLKR